MTTRKIDKRAAHKLAEELGLEVEATETAAQVAEEIQQAVDEWGLIVAAGGVDERVLLELAASHGFEPLPMEDPVELASAIDGEDAAAEGEVADGEIVEGEVEVVEAVDGEPDPEPAPELTVGDVADEVGRALALREQAVVPTHALPTPGEYNVLGLLANRTFNTTFVPVAYRGREADVFAAFLFGREIGLGPMMALRDVHMIEGRPSLAAHRQLAKLREGGVVVLESESTAERAWIKARRADTGEVMAVEFTMEEAQLIVDKKGGRLVDKVNWRSYPADMLWARTVGRLTRRLGPDIAGGLPPYTAEEAADFSGWGVAYGDAGPIMSEPGPAAEMPAYRREYPDYNWPSSMVEIRDRLAITLGDDGEAAIWLRQAREALYPDMDKASATKEQRDVLFQKLSSVLAMLDGPDGPTPFEVGVRAKIQAAFASRLEGAILEGPAWSLGPDEAEARPPRKSAPQEPAPEATSAPETSSEPEAEAAPAESEGEAPEGSESYYAQFDDVDDIPFGPAGSDSP